MAQGLVWIVVIGCLYLAATASLTRACFVSTIPRQERHTAHRPSGHFASHDDNVRTIEPSTKESDLLLLPPRPHIIFPGGGIFFYWQAGAIQYLRDECHYNLTAATCTGASAGALTATLAATDVDFYRATDLALTMAQKSGVWSRSGGLQGIWGEMIEDWLEELLPDDAVERAERHGLSLLVTPVPKLGKETIQTFRDRKDLIDANMASIHLPWFLDGKWVSTFRQKPYIDGSFLAAPADYHADQPSSQTLILGHQQDPNYQTKNLLSFVEAFSPDTIWNMLEDGKRYAKTLEEQGKLSFLQEMDTSKDV